MQPWLAQCARGRSGPCAGLHPAAGLRPACGRGSLPPAVPYIREMVEASAFLADGRCGTRVSHAQSGPHSTPLEVGEGMRRGPQVKEQAYVSSPL